MFGILVYMFAWAGVGSLPRKKDGENRVIIMAIMSDENVCFREVF